MLDRLADIGALLWPRAYQLGGPAQRILLSLLRPRQASIEGTPEMLATTVRPLPLWHHSFGLANR